MPDFTLDDIRQALAGPLLPKTPPSPMAQALIGRPLPDVPLPYGSDPFVGSPDSLGQVKQAGVLPTDDGLRSLWTGQNRESSPLTNQFAQAAQVGMMTELPMDYASRMARAKDMGFTTDAYHGTRAPVDFNEFSTDGPPVDELTGYARDSGSGADPSAYMGAHFAVEPQIASKFATGEGAQWLKSRHVESGEAGSRVLPVKLRGNFKEFANDDAVQKFIYSQPSNHPAVEMELDRLADGDPDQMDELGQRYDNDPEFREEVNRDAMETESRDNEDGGTEFAQDLASQARGALEKQGYHGFKHKNTVEGGHAVSVFDPKNIRSTAAAFDPKMSNSGNLLASHAGLAGALGGAAGIAAAASGMYPTEQPKKGPTPVAIMGTRG